MRIGTGRPAAAHAGLVRLPAGLRSVAGAARGVTAPRRWGRVDADALPYGITRYRLVVYPPGIGAGARLRVRAWRAWPVTGAMVSVGVALAASVVVDPLLAAVTGCLAYLGGFLALGASALPERRAVRQVWAEDPGESAALDDVVGVARVRLLGELLCAADDALADGELCEPEFQGVWRCVYDQVGGLLAPDPDRVDPVGRA